MLTSKKTIILSIILLVASMGAFLYSNAYASPVTCPVCSGQFGEDMDCVEVNLGGYQDCEEFGDGTCNHIGSKCDPEPE